MDISIGILFLGQEGDFWRAENGCGVFNRFCVKQMC